MSRNPRVKWWATLSVAVVLTLTTMAVAGVPKELAGLDHGLCAVIGAGDSAHPALVAQLASPTVLVHGIAVDDAALERAHQAIAAAKVEGLASVEKLSLSLLPYRDTLVNFVVVPDLAAARAVGLTEAEMLRVLAPGGKLITGEDGRWETTVKPVPKEMDEWTHDRHGPDGTSVSNDLVVRFPVGFRWHAGIPMNLHNRKQPANVWSDTRGLALSGGRCFTLSSSVIENLGPTFSSEHGIDQYVTCRDAFNGMFQWRTKIGPTYYAGLYYPNRAPFVAVGDSVYVASGEGKLWALDAKTGAIARKFDTAFPPCRLLVDEGIVAVACWKEGTRLGGLVGVDRRSMDWGVPEGTVEAFDARTGRQLWKLSKLATSLQSSGGVLFMIQRVGADRREEMGFGHKEVEEGKVPLPARPQQHPVAVNLRTGQTLWETKLANPELHEALSVDAAGYGAVAIGHNNGRKTSILSAADGRVLALVAGNSYAAFHDGAIHLGGKKYDPATGKDIGASKLRLSSTICTPSYYVNNITVQNRGGTINVEGKAVLYGGARGACFFASTPAFGAFYTPQNWCSCAPAQIPGFICFGPIAHEPTAEEMRQSGPVELGLTMAPIQPSTAVAAQSADWPMYRHDAGRSNATSADAPTALDVVWQRSVVAPAPNSTIGCDWRERLEDPLTAPVVAEGAVLAAATDRNQVIALDALTGRPLWRANVGSRLDSPPTIHRGICLVGSHDGYVYAFRRDSGKLAWRMRAAPREERMVAGGKVESPWPVIGTVLVDGEVAYVSAGHTQGSDGGIVVRAFDPASGRPSWSQAIVMTTKGAEYREMRRNDLLVKIGNAVQLMTTRLDATTGEFVTNPSLEMQKFQERQRRALQAVKKQPLGATVKEVKPLEEAFTIDEIAPGIGLEGFLPAAWTRLGNRKYQAMAFGNVSAPQLSWGDGVVCGNPGDGKTICAFNRDKVAPYGTKPDPKIFRWRHNLPEDYQATSVVTSNGAVAIGGGVYSPGEAGRGFVRVLSADKGQTFAEKLFESPLVYNSVAVAGQRIYATLTDGSVVCLGRK